MAGFLSAGVVGQQQNTGQAPATQAEAMADFSDAPLIAADLKQEFQCPYLLFVPLS